MNDKEKIDWILSEIFTRSNYRNGLYQKIEKVGKFNFQWKPRGLFGTNHLKKQLDIVDNLIEEAIYKGEDINDTELLTRIGVEAVAQTSGIFVVFTILVIAGSILWFIFL